MKYDTSFIVESSFTQLAKVLFGMNGSDHPSLCYKTGNVDMLHSLSIEPF